MFVGAKAHVDDDERTDMATVKIIDSIVGRWWWQDKDDMVGGA